MVVHPRLAGPAAAVALTLALAGCASAASAGADAGDATLASPSVTASDPASTSGPAPSASTGSGRGSSTSPAPGTTTAAPSSSASASASGTASTSARPTSAAPTTGRSTPAPTRTSARPTTTSPKPTTSSPKPSTPSSPRLTVSRTTGLDPDGVTLTIRGRGYDTAIGVYVALCTSASPREGSTCLGGADLTGASGASAWVSSNPPPYGKDLAVPYGSGGSFTVTITVKASSGALDCHTTRCGVVTRADHTRYGDRSQDVFIPVTFAR